MKETYLKQTAIHNVECIGSRKFQTKIHKSEHPKTSITEGGYNVLSN